MMRPEAKSLRSLSVGRPTPEKAEQRTGEILHVATEVFLEHGFNRAKISDIIERVGGSKGTIYARYPTKSDLFIAVIDQENDILHEHFVRALSTKLPLQKVLEEFGLTLLEAIYSADIVNLIRILSAESKQFPDLARKFLTKGPLHAIKMLSECLAKHPEFKGSSPTEAAEFYCALFWGTFIFHHLLDRKHSPKRSGAKPMLKSAVRLFLAAYGRR